MIDIGAQVLSNQIDRSRIDYRLLEEIPHCESELNSLTQQFLFLLGITSAQWEHIDSMLRRVSTIINEARRDLRRQRPSRTSRYIPYDS